LTHTVYPTEKRCGGPIAIECLCLCELLNLSLQQHELAVCRCRFSSFCLLQNKIHQSFSVMNLVYAIIRHFVLEHGQTLVEGWKTQLPSNFRQWHIVNRFPYLWNQL